jgi:S-adenosylmethionine:tRNA ribosyltransferase-isomerase
MSPATTPRAPETVRVLVVGDGPLRVVDSASLVDQLEPGDLLVVNDAATLPASFDFVTEAGEDVELRILTAEGDRDFLAALLGAGDWHTRTEYRPLPPRVILGTQLRSRRDPELVATIVGSSRLSPRAVHVRFGIAGRADASIAEVWSAIYRGGRPVQYAHVPEALALWDVQNAWASRPWAVEMPSAGRVLRAGTILALRKKGVGVVRVTHAAGLSATGDPDIDGALPLPERWEVPRETVLAILAARRRGGRVIAVGTSVVRALESAAVSGILTPGEGVTDLRIGPRTTLRVADGILTGVHESDTTHFALLGAFASKEELDGALHRAVENGLLGHEFGDAWLVWGKEACALRASLPAA